MAPSYCMVKHWVHLCRCVHGSEWLEQLLERASAGLLSHQHKHEGNIGFTHPATLTTGQRLLACGLSLLCVLSEDWFCLLQAVSLAIEDITKIGNDPEHLSIIIMQQIEALQSSTSQHVTSLCSGGSMRAAREMAFLQRPDVLSLDCASHQV